MGMMRTSCFNERAERLGRNRQINTLNKNEIDIISPSKAVLKLLDKELRHKDTKAYKATITRENAISCTFPLPHLIMKWFLSQTLLYLI